MQDRNAKEPQNNPSPTTQATSARRNRLRKIGMITLSGSVALLLLRAWAQQSQVEAVSPELSEVSKTDKTNSSPKAEPPPSIADKIPPQEAVEPTFEGEYEAPSAADSVEETEPIEDGMGKIGGTGSGYSNGKGIGGKAVPRIPRVRQAAAKVRNDEHDVWGGGGGILGGVAGGLVSGRRMSGRALRRKRALGGTLGSMAATSGHFAMNNAPSESSTPVKAKLISTKETKFSTISTDVDTASYARMRSKVIDDRPISAGNVRVEEFINYFDYDIPDSSGEHPIGVVTETGPAPWSPDRVLMRVGIKAKAKAQALHVRKNLVFLLDVSGSMMGAGGLDLVKFGLNQLLETLSPNDRVAIVVYAGSSGVVLNPTQARNKEKIRYALNNLRAGGSTNGGAGLRLAYKLAKQHYVKGGINRVILATDGDFNVGIRGEDALTEYVEKKRKLGVYLSVLGFSASNYADRAMEQLADHGNGNYAYIDSEREAKKALLAQAQGTLSPVADDVKIQVEFDPELVSGHKVVGYKNRKLAKKDFMDDKKDAGDMGAGQATTALYELELTPKARQNPQASLASIAVRYRPFGKKKHQMFKVEQSGVKSSLDDTSDDFRFTAGVAQFAQVLEHEVTGEALAQTHRLVMNARGEDKDCLRGEFAELVKAYACGTVGMPAKSWSKVHGCELGALRAELEQCDSIVEPEPKPVITTPIQPPVEAETAPAPTETKDARSPFEHLATFFELLASWLRALPRWAALIPGALGLGLWFGNRSNGSLPPRTR